MPSFEDRIAYVFKDKTLLQQALTHSSAAANTLSYERLEFLGDRILGLVIAEALFATFPAESEGAMARRLNALVKKETLYEVAQDAGLTEVLISASSNTVTPSVLADAVEALIAALYLDGGLANAKTFIHSFWQKRIDTNDEPFADEKSLLQELAQARGLSLPAYRVVERLGPDHKPHFIVEATLADNAPQRGEGASKQLAEKMAAKNLYTSLVGHND